MFTVTDMSFTDKFKFIKTSCVENKCPTITALTAIDRKFGKNMGDRQIGRAHV